MTSDIGIGPDVLPAGATERRRPVARYVEFGDEHLQERFIGLQEAAFQTLLAADVAETSGQVELRSPVPETRRGVFRRAPQAVSQVVTTSPALARVAWTAAHAPGEVAAAPNACTSSRRVADMLSAVATDLVRDLLPLSPEDQVAHPAYRQTLRLAGELQALVSTVNASPCTNTDGCVGIRPPEHWGRRAEDVEVAEVRAVLLQLAVASRAQRHLA